MKGTHTTGLGDDTYRIVSLYINDHSQPCVRDYIALDVNGDGSEMIVDPSLDSITIYPTREMAVKAFCDATKTVSPATANVL